MTDIDKIRAVSKRWAYVDEAPGGLIAFDDVNDLLEIIDKTHDELVDLRRANKRAEAALKAANFEIGALREDRDGRVALRDAVLEELWSGATDPSIPKEGFGEAVGIVLEEWFSREGEPS